MLDGEGTHLRDSGTVAVGRRKQKVENYLIFLDKDGNTCPVPEHKRPHVNSFTYYLKLGLDIYSPSSLSFRSAKTCHFVTGETSAHGKANGNLFAESVKSIADSDYIRERLRSQLYERKWKLRMSGENGDCKMASKLPSVLQYKHSISEEASQKVKYRNVNRYLYD